MTHIARLISKLFMAIGRGLANSAWLYGSSVGLHSRGLVPGAQAQRVAARSEADR